MVIILWVFNWICWKRKCCCLEAFDEYCNKVFSWWLSWVFLCGILACCIAGFVTANRFGFASYGVQCAYERIYYDSKYGQLKKTYPKWEGFAKLKETKHYLNNTISTIVRIEQPLKNISLYSTKDEIKETDKFNLKDVFFYPIPQDLANSIIETAQSESDKKNIIKDIENIKLDHYFKIYDYNLIIQYSSIIKNLKNYYQSNKIDTLINMEKSFETYKSKFIKKFYYYVKLARAFGRIIPIIYFSLLLIFVVGSGALLITYYCKKVNQQWWILPMHIAWNGIRFFMFSFFMYGCAYGMLFLGAKDSIAYLQYAFSEENLNSDETIIIPKDAKKFLNYCLLSDTTILDNIRGDGLLDKFWNELIKFESYTRTFSTELSFVDPQKVKDYLQELKTNVGELLSQFDRETIEFFRPKIEQAGTIYANFNCSFINNTINLMYRAMWDFAWETRILCALSCCIGFFGIFAVYSFLWVMFLWRKEDNNYNSYNKIYKNNQNYYPKKYKNIKPPQDIDDETNTELVNTNNKYNNNDNNNDNSN